MTVIISEWVMPVAAKLLHFPVAFAVVSIIIDLLSLSLDPPLTLLPPTWRINALWKLSVCHYFREIDCFRIPLLMADIIDCLQLRSSRISDPPVAIIADAVVHLVLPPRSDEATLSVPPASLGFAVDVLHVYLDAESD